MPAKKPRKRRPANPRRPKPKAVQKSLDEIQRKMQELKMEEERTLFLKEQTVLAKERTILSFMRTGLGFVTAGFAIIAATSIMEAVLKMHPAVPTVIGAALVGVGFLEIFESFRRLRAYKRKMKQITFKLGEEDI